MGVTPKQFVCLFVFCCGFLFTAASVTAQAQNMDINGDGSVTIADLTSLVLQWHNPQIDLTADEKTNSLDGAKLIQYLSVPTASPSGNTVTITSTIINNNRDAWSGNSHTGQINHEVRISGFNTTDEPFEFVSNDGDEESGAMQFQIQIPKGAQILNAAITVTAGSFQNPSSTGGMKIQVYDVANAQSFQSGFFGDLANHHPTASTFVQWNNPTRWPDNSQQQSPNLAPLVQHIINRSDYTPGNYIGFVLTEGTIASGSYYGWKDSITGMAPTLTVSYLPIAP